MALSGLQLVVNYYYSLLRGKPLPGFFWNKVMDGIVLNETRKRTERFFYALQEGLTIAPRGPKGLQEITGNILYVGHV